MDLDKLLKKKQRVKRGNNIKQLAETIKELGDAYFECGRLEEALQEYLEQLEVCEVLNDKLNYAVAHRMIGEVYANLGNYEEALIHQNYYLEGAKEMKNLLEEQRAYATLGRTYFFLAESYTSAVLKKEEALTNAKKAYTKSIQLCNELENSSIKLQEMMMMRARLFLNLGLTLEAQGEPQEAINLIEKAAELCTLHNLQEDLFRTQLAIAAFNERQKHYDMALKYIDNAANIKNTILQSEAHLAKVELLMRLGKWMESRKILVSLYIKKGLPENIKKQVQKYLRIVVTLCRSESSVEQEDDITIKQKLYETLGDAAVAVHAYEKAICYYEEMLTCAEQSNSKQIGAALVSIAQTLRDAGRCSEAIKFARKELNLYNDPKEMCRSALFLADLLVSTKSPDEEIRTCYNHALENAKLSKNAANERSVLKDFLFYLENTDQNDEARLVEEKLNKLQDVVDDKESDDDAESTDIGADICLSELSDMEDEAKVTDGAVASRRRPKRGLVIKKNDKGETQLHVACINGNIDNVEKLLSAGHPTNVRDNCGWTPLHEAANHDYIEIAKLLLKHGANVNDPGGMLCGGITPLHDAASCGNLSMIYLLMKHGGNLLLKTADGDTILDCLLKWKDRAGTLSDRAQEEYNCLYQKLVSIIPRHTSKEKQSTTSKTIHNTLIDEDADTEEENHKISAAEDYKRTIANLKNRGGIVGSITKRANVLNQVPALLDNEEELLDDWLDDDIGVNRKKSLGSTNSSISFKRKSDPPNADNENDTKRMKIVPVENNIDDTIIINENSSDSNISEEVTDIFDQSVNIRPKHKRQISLLKTGFTRNTMSRTPSPVSKPTTNVDSISPCVPDTANLKIFIDRLIMNIKFKPSQQEKDTFSGIIKSIKTKFQEETGCKTEFILKTMNDDVLSPSNILNMITQNNIREFVCEIIEIQIPHIIERYKIICSSYSTVADDNIIKQLKSCENTSVFRLRSTNVGMEEFVPLLKTLEYQKNLQVLHLSGGYLVNNGEVLNQSITTITTLQELYLQSCDIDYSCLSKIEKLPLHLAVLDFSYNPLGPKSCEILAKLLAPLKNLQYLNLCCCELDNFRFNIHNSNLVNLNLSWNSMGSGDVCNFLQRQLLTLSLSGTSNQSNSSLIPDILSKSKLCFRNLETLELSACFILDTDVKNILSEALNLSKIVLSGNQNVTVTSVSALLSYKPTLTHIDINGCTTIEESPPLNLHIENPERCTLIVNMLSNVCLLWLNLWQGNGTVNELPHSLIIFRPA